MPRNRGRVGFNSLASAGMPRVFYKYLSSVCSALGLLWAPLTLGWEATPTGKLVNGIPDGFG